MSDIVDLFHRLLNAEGIIAWGGLAAVTLIVFVETGLLVGFFLPGDSLLVTAGVLAAAGHLHIAALIALCVAAAVAGDQVNFAFGRRLGPAIVTRYPRLRVHITRAQAFYRRYGSRTIVLARFVPIVRTFAPAVAGAAEMPYRAFLAANVGGAALWVGTTAGGGYLLGRAVPNLDRYLLAVVAAVVVASIVPVAVERWRSWRRGGAPVGD